MLLLPGTFGSKSIHSLDVARILRLSDDFACMEDLGILINYLVLDNSIFCDKYF